VKIAFAGTPEFARVVLKGLHAAGWSIDLVLTQPDRPAGRGMKLQASAVKQWAVEHSLTVLQPQGLRLDGRFADDAQACQQVCQNHPVDVLVVVAYGLILPAWVLAWPRLGCLNIHASLLPRWRGAAPIHRAIEAGDAQTGITVMQMDAGLDTGGVLAMCAQPIRADDTTASLHDRLAEMGSSLIIETLERAALEGPLHATPQPAQGVTYAAKIEKAQAFIDWRCDAALIERRIRAFDPFPGAAAVFKGEVLKCWRAQVVELPTISGFPGQVLAVNESAIAVACGQGVLRMVEVQRPGGKRMSVAQYLQSRAVTTDDFFEVAANTG
jgi:methionyl-tRNA formyltransferase